MKHTTVFFSNHRLIRSLLLLTALFTASFIQAWQPNDDRGQWMFDSVMAVMRDQTIPLIERYYMTGDIEHLSREHQIEVLKVLLPEAKEVDDYAIRMRLYALIGGFYARISQFEAAEQYLDSAFVNIDKTDNEIIRGLTYYNLGFYYMMRNKISEAHDFHYKAAECFNKRDPHLNILCDIYYNLSIVYAQNHDVESLEELNTWMKDVTVAFPVQQTLKYTVRARYFRALHERTGDVAYLDSVTLYNRMSFEVFLSEEQPYDVAYQIAENYYSQAEVFFLLQQLDSAQFYLERSLALANPNQFFSKLQAQLLSSRLFVSRGDFQQAEAALLDAVAQAETLVDTKDAYFYNLLSDYYELLSQIWEKQGKMKEALDAGRKSLKYELMFAELSNSAFIQNLRVKYDLDSKQRSIEQLTEINRINEQNRLLFISAAGLALVVFLLILFLAAKRQRFTQAKLKEATLISQLEQEKNESLKAKIKENEQQYQFMMSENKLKQRDAYFKGLESERARLSKELHDNIANHILAVGLQLQNQTVTNVPDLSKQLKDLHEQVRHISHELIPPAFQYASFVEILKDYVSQQNSLDKLEIFLSIDSENDVNAIPENICTELYRIIQECIGNAFKHSAASHVEILLFLENNRINLTIIDDGKGFDPKVRSGKGIGLIIVTERLKRLNGDLQINSAPNKGAELNIIVPLGS